MTLKVHTEKLYGQEAILENVKVKQGLTFTDTYMQSLFNTLQIYNLRK